MVEARTSPSTTETKLYGRLCDSLGIKCHLPVLELLHASYRISRSSCSENPLLSLSSSSLAPQPGGSQTEHDEISKSPCSDKEHLWDLFTLLNSSNTIRARTGLSASDPFFGLIKETFLPCCRCSLLDSNAQLFYCCRTQAALFFLTSSEAFYSS